MRKKMSGPMGPSMAPPHMRQPRRKGIPPGYGSPGGVPMPPQQPGYSPQGMKSGGQYGTGGMKNPNKPAVVAPSRKGK